MKLICNSNTLMENFESECLNRIPADLLAYSEMTDAERRFINGLIRYHRPKRILEIGVAEGAGSLVILNTIQDDSDAYLTSIDIADYHYNYSNANEKMHVGEVAKNCNNLDSSDSKWKLITGKDPVEVMESIGIIDFCIIDSGHVHPIESLNFLVVLPYLSADAIVVLHDIAIYRSYIPEFRNMHAPKLLFDSVVADKLLPCQRAYYNIAAFQITPGTRKYISNVFSMLSFRWDCPPAMLSNHYDYFLKHYNSDFVEYYLEAIRANVPLLAGQGTSVSVSPGLKKHFSSAWDDLVSKKGIILYGAGSNCLKLLEFWGTHKHLYAEVLLPPVFEIWDINADKISSVHNIPVVLPRFSTLNGSSDYAVIITLQSKGSYYFVSLEITKNGFSNVFEFDDILPMLTAKGLA